MFLKHCADFQNAKSVDLLVSKNSAKILKYSYYRHVLINKPKFLLAFLVSFPKAFTKKNIKRAF